MSPDGKDEGAAALSNADFRKLVAEAPARPSKTRQPELTEEEKAARDAKKTADKARRERKRQVMERIEERRAEQAEREEKYRDRAAERRAGKKDAEYEDHEELLQAYQNLAEAADDHEQLTEVERRERAIEASKYLGGDIQRTHLVKGLDYALLQKSREDAARQAGGGAKNDKQGGDGSATDVQAVKTAVAPVASTGVTPGEEGGVSGQAASPSRLCHPVLLVAPWHAHSG